MDYAPLEINQLSLRMPSKKQTLNPFITAATPLLTLMSQIKYSQKPPNVETIRKNAIGEIKLFEEYLLKFKYNPRTILAARYCLCTAVDETVLSTNWGTKSIWSQQSLLSLFHKETWGGERFYIILENMIKDPRHNSEITELLYLLLSLGFEGKYFNKGKVIRDEIRTRLFQHIRHTRGKITRTLSPQWKDHKSFQNNQHKRSAIKRLLISTGAILLSIIIIFNIKADRITSPVLKKLNSIGKESPVTAYSQLIDRSIVPSSFH